MVPRKSRPYTGCDFFNGGSMNIEEIRKKIVEYSKNYDLTIPDIMRKFHHSFRVMEFSKEIARSRIFK